MAAPLGRGRLGGQRADTGEPGDDRVSGLGWRLELRNVAKLGQHLERPFGVRPGSHPGGCHRHQPVAFAVEQQYRAFDLADRAAVGLTADEPSGFDDRPGGVREVLAVADHRRSPLGHLDVHGDDLGRHPARVGAAERERGRHHRLDRHEAPLPSQKRSEHRRRRQREDGGDQRIGTHRLERERRVEQDEASHGLGRRAGFEQRDHAAHGVA